MLPDSPPTLVIRRLARSLEQHFERLQPWLALDDPRWRARPGPDAWSAGEIIEHLALCQRYLLLLVDKIAARCLRRRAAGAALPGRASDLAFLEALCLRSFTWPHPEHMTPSGAISRQALARELEAQRERCQEHLRRLPAGEGCLHAIGMSVVGRKLDLYQYLRLIDLHLERHLAQLERTLAAVSAGPGSGPQPPADDRAP